MKSGRIVRLRDRPGLQVGLRQCLDLLHPWLVGVGCAAPGSDQVPPALTL